MRFFLVPLFCCFYCSLFAQINIPSTTIVSENFNGIGSAGNASLPANWKMSAAGAGSTSAWSAGTNITATTQAANSGTPVTGGAYNWATSTGTDRAIGFMSSGSYSSPNSIMAFYRNTTGATVTTITVSFAIERYRTNTSSFTLNFFSSTDGSTWTARTGGDISAAAFATGAGSYTFGSPQTVIRTVTISGLNIASNGDFYLRWLFTDGAAATAQGVGLDNVAVFAGVATPVIMAKLTDQLSIDNGTINQANPGDQLTYTTTIKNTGTGDATNVTLTEPAPANTTLTGSVTTSALARNDVFITAFNTALTGSNVLTNDFGLPSPTVVSFGPSANAAATAAGGTGSSDNGGTVVLNSNGTFSYTPAAGFTGTDKFSYIATTGTAPDNEATVTVTVGAAATANADTYSIIGNVSIAPNAAAGIITNDAGSNIAITAVNGSAANIATNISTIQGGTLNVAANGSFTYDPPAGYEGADNFTYTIDNGFGMPATATVTLNISGMIWFVNNAAGAGDGRLSSPFNTLSALNAVNNGAGNNPGANDYIFIYESATDYLGNLTLMNGQKLIGQDATATLATITGFTMQSYSTALPVTNSVNGTIVNITTTAVATNAVTVNAAGGTNLLRGFTIGNKTGTGITGSNFGTLTVSEVTISGTGQSLLLNTGTLSATISSLSSSSGTTAVSLTTVGGSLTINGGTISGSTGTAFAISGGTVSVSCAAGITQANNAALLSISGGHGTGTVSFNTGTLSATNGTGLQFDNADGTYNFNGTTTLNGGDAGIDILNGSAGTFTFGTGTTITSPAGIGFNIGGVSASTCNVTFSGNITQASNAAMVNISNGHNTGTITFQTGTLSATNGIGLRFDDADGAYNFNGAVTLNGGDAGIDILNGSAGNFSFLNAPITNPTGTAFNVSGGNGSIGHAGAISKTSAGRIIDIQSRTGGSVTLTGNLSSTTSSTGINVSGNSGGTITFSGTTKTLNTPGSNSVNLSSNTGATINFTGGNLAITSTTATGFNATGGGTISVQGTVNTITSTTGTALNVANTTISAGGLTFQSISSNGGSNTGIILDNTGANAGLTIAGTGTAGSGGTIANKTGTDGSTSTGIGIYLNNTRSISLTRMQLNDFQNFGIRGSVVINFTMDNCIINGTNGNNAGLDEASIRFSELTGSASIFNCNISGAVEDNIGLVNTSGSLNRITISNTTIGANSTASGNDGIFIEAQNSASINATIQNSFFTASRGDLFQFNQAGTGSCDIIFSSNTCSNNHPAIVAGGGGVVVGGIKGTLTFDISNNSFRDATGTALALATGGNADGTFCIASGKIENNQIGVAAITNSGSTSASGIAIVNSGGGTSRVTVNGNAIRQYNNHGILLQAGQTLGNPVVFEMTITGNTISNPGNINSDFNGIHLNNGTLPGENFTSCVNILNNSVAGSGRGTTAPNNNDIRLRQRQATSVRLPGYGGANNNDAAVVSYLIGRQTTVTTVAASNTTPTGGGYIGGAACLQ